MNVTPLSFQGSRCVVDSQDNVIVGSKGARKSSNMTLATTPSSLEREPQTDTFTPKQPQKKKKVAEIARQQRRIGLVEGLIIGAALAAGATSFALKPQPPATRYTLPADDEPYAQVEEIEQMYGVSPEMVLYYNGLDYVDDIKDEAQISFPSPYDYLEKSIEETRRKLSKNLKPEQRIELEEKLASLIEKQQKQQETATVFSDGKKIYYQITTPDGINVERFKDLFDIKDGVIRLYNKIPSVWKVDGEYDPETNDGYYDYTGARLVQGKIIQVPVNAIKK